MCGVGNKGVNILNYVDLSGIYQIWDVVWVFEDRIVIPPGLSILATVWSSCSTFRAFREVGGWR